MRYNTKEEKGTKRRLAPFYRAVLFSTIKLSKERRKRPEIEMRAFRGYYERKN